MCRIFHAQGELGKMIDYNIMKNLFSKGTLTAKSLLWYSSTKYFFQNVLFLRKLKNSNISGLNWKSLSASSKCSLFPTFSYLRKKNMTKSCRYSNISFHLSLRNSVSNCVCIQSNQNDGRGNPGLESSCWPLSVVQIALQPSLQPFSR